MSDPAPVPSTLAADPAWRCIDLLSDVHLHADMPRTFAAWRHHLLHTPADAVLILGDLFEVWIGDDAATDAFASRPAPACCARRRTSATWPSCPATATSWSAMPCCSSAVCSGWQTPRCCGPSERRWLLTHGDALCLGDTDYLRFRAQVRSPAWQQAFLALPLVERERQARAMRAASMAHQAQQGPAGWSDVDPDEAARWLAAAGSRTLVHGHTHRPGVHALPGGGERQVLGDWDVDHGAPRAWMLRLTAWRPAAAGRGRVMTTTAP